MTDADINPVQGVGRTVLLLVVRCIIYVCRHIMEQKFQSICLRKQDAQLSQRGRAMLRVCL